MITKEVTSVFSMKSLGYMLNNIYFVVMYVFDVHNSFFCHFQSKLFSKVLCYSHFLDRFSCFSLQRPTSAS